MPRLFNRLKLTWGRASDHNIGLMAAGIAYYGFLSFMPLLIAIVLGYGLVADQQTVAAHTAELAVAMPPSAAELVGEQLSDIADDRGTASGFGLVIALVIALFGARAAAMAIITAFNDAFDVAETRPIIRANLVALAITVGAVLALGVVAGTIALASIVFAGDASGMATFLVVGFAGFAGAAIGYRVVPNFENLPWKPALAGATLFAFGWTTVSSAFGFYAANIGNYNATYGSLGAIAVFLTWLFLSAYLLLLGAHFASVSADKV